MTLRTRSAYARLVRHQRLRTSTAPASRRRRRSTPAARARTRNMPTSSSGCSSAAVPRTPAMMTGTVIGYNSTGSSTSRLRARTSIAANSVPTDGRSRSCPPARMRGQPERMRRSSGAWNSNATSGTRTQLDARQQRQDAEQLADVDRRPGGRRQQQRAQRLGLALALERAARAPAFPANAIAIHRIAAPRRLRRRALAHERKREHQDARHREEQRRVGDLAAAHLDRQVLAQDQPGRRGRSHASARCAHHVAIRATAGAPAAHRGRPRGRRAGTPPRPAAFGEVEIVRGQRRRWRRSRAALRSRATQRRGRRIVEAGERLVEQRPAAARESARARARRAGACRARSSSTGSSRAVGQAGARRAPRGQPRDASAVP